MALVTPTNSDGEKIDTVAAGATSITVTDGSTAIVAGNRILIYGFDCQGSGAAAVSHPVLGTLNTIPLSPRPAQR